ncbi:MAG: hypothetical protein ACKPKO_42940, partial [Candidatus Fonsibacter sp.]
ELANRWPAGIKVFDKKSFLHAITRYDLSKSGGGQRHQITRDHWNLEVEVVHPAQVQGNRNHFWNLVSRAACPVSQSPPDETVNCLNKF